MGRPKVNWKDIFGKDADLLVFCQRRGHVTPTLDDLLDFLDEYQVVSDPAFEQHRKRLSGDEKTWLERLVKWRFGYKTYNQPFPSLSWWAHKLGFSCTHATYILKFLVKQGLLTAERAKNGLAYVFSVDPLLEKVRGWLGLKSKARAFQPVAQVEEVVEWEGEEQPKPAPIPLPVPMPEPKPIAAIVPAPEWRAALPRIESQIGKAAFQSHFYGAQAYRRNGRLVIEACNRSQWDMFSHRFMRLLNGLFGEVTIILARGVS